MTGAQAVVATLREHGVNVVFGIPGVHTLPLYDAMYDQPALRHVLARHEQGAGYMGYGYAHATGQPGVVCTITGPGVTNAVTAAANAYADSTPVLFLSSGPARTGAGQSTGALHELKNQLGLMREVVGWSHAVTCVDEIPQALCHAFENFRSQRPRAAYLELPFDLLEAKCDLEIPTPRSIPRLAPDESSVHAAVQLLRRSESPLIIAGAGVTAAGANEQLMRLAELLNTPVLLGAKSRDVLPTDHPLVIATSGYAMSDALLDLIGRSDAVLVVGSKLGEERTNGRRLPLPANLVHIDIDPYEVGRRYPATVGISADARLTLEALLSVPIADLGERRGREQEIAAVRAAQRRLLQETIPGPMRLLDAVRESLPTDAVVVADMTQVGYASARYLPVREPRTFIHPSEFCAIGCGLPIGIGAKVGVPDRPVLILAGDGGVVLNVSELAVAAQEQIDVTLVVVNDGAYTAVKKEQGQRYRRYLATDVRGPDFVSLARAYGVHGVRVSEADELSGAITTAITHRGTTLIEIPSSAMPG
jgi:acetolactate synthase-1/2/3 large subunit